MSIRRKIEVMGIDIVSDEKVPDGEIWMDSPDGTRHIWKFPIDVQTNTQGPSQEVETGPAEP